MMWNRANIHWRMPTAMIACYIVGLGLAISHHFYYYSLNGKTVGGQSKQAWALRIGTGLAFLTKTFLTTAVGMACVQNLWWILRMRPIRVSTLDSMFDIRDSIFNFFDLHIWLWGPNVAVLGLISWLIPLVTVVTPSTLSVQSSVEQTVRVQQIPKPVYDFGRYTTMSEGGPENPTPSIARLVTSSAMQGAILNLAVPAPNSSYTLDFIGPYIKCNNASSTLTTIVNNKLGDGNYFRVEYVGFASSGNVSSDIDSLIGHGPVISWSWENVNSTDYAGKLIMAVYDHPPARSVVECGIYNASYTVNFDFVNGAQSVKIANLEILNRVLPVGRLSTPKNREMFSYTSILNVLGDLLIGVCYTYPSRCVSSQIYSTTLVNSKENYDVVWGDTEEAAKMPPLADVAAEMGENITLSLFSNSYFLQNSTQAGTTNVTIYQNVTKYLYAERNLLIAYGVAVFISLLCVISGILTMMDNGVAFTDSFSTLIRATRNSEFSDVIPITTMTGADPPPRELVKTRVQWMPSSGGSENIAGLKPFLADDDNQKKKYEQVQQSSDGLIPYSNTLPDERGVKKNQQLSSISHINASRDGFI